MRLFVAISGKLSLYVGVSLTFSPMTPKRTIKHPGDSRTQWETPRGCGKVFNVTTEPVSLLCFLLGSSHVPWHQFLDERVAVEERSEQQEHKSSPAMESRLGHLNQWLVDRDLCVLTCLWKVACLGQRTVQQTMEHQAWILRSLLAKLEKQEAEGEDSPNSTAGEFAVSPVLFSSYWNVGVFDQALREWVYNIFNSSKRGKSAKNGSTLHLRFLFAVTLVHEIGRPWGKSMSATRSMKALKVSCLCKFQKALLEITNRYTLKQQQPCSTEVWSLSVTSSVGCCHGNEWHGRAWGLRRVLHMLSCCCHPVRAQTTREERVCCITSFANKKHSVSKAAQTVCEAF